MFKSNIVRVLEGFRHLRIRGALVSGILFLTSCAFVVTGRSARASDASTLFDAFERRPEAPFGLLDPDAPAALAQFAFLIGEFSCEGQRRDPYPGAPWRDDHGRWRAQYIMNGWAIQDEYFDSSTTFLGIRYFSPREEAWTINFYNAPGEISPTVWKGRVEEAGMVVRRDIELPDGTPAEVRLSFHDVTDTSFRWRNDTAVGDHLLTTWRLECRRSES